MVTQAERSSAGKTGSAFALAAREAPQAHPGDALGTDRYQPRLLALRADEPAPAVELMADVDDAPLEVEPVRSPL